jgi:hypothetical protein
MRLKAVEVPRRPTLPLLAYLVRQGGIKDNAKNAANVRGVLARSRWLPSQTDGSGNSE